MIEVVFSDSAKGAMRVAKAYDKEGMSDAAVAYVGKEPSKKEKRELADGEAVGGSPQDVVCIGAHLDMGDISGEITGEARKRAFAQAFVSVRFEDCEVERFFKRQREDLEKLFASAKAGGRIRVWTSSAPFSACGFAFLCDALRSIACKISVIALPEYGAVALPAYFEKPDRALLWADWSQVWPG
ncbi:MAG: DUF1835 domain-containing protein, partial [Clostridiales Family XIII bacterium]|nr:DUF1835 domain-containing protein [Clostridiales Family XIII bacterium]